MQSRPRLTGRNEPRPQIMAKGEGGGQGPDLDTDTSDAGQDEPVPAESSGVAPEPKLQNKPRTIFSSNNFYAAELSLMCELRSGKQVKKIKIKKKTQQKFLLDRC